MTALREGYWCSFLWFWERRLICSMVGDYYEFRRPTKARNRANDPGSDPRVRP